VWVAPPGGALGSYPVPGSQWTASQRNELTALGAGAGSALVGIRSITVTNEVNPGSGGGGCTGQATPTDETDWSVESRAEFVGGGVTPSLHTFGTGTASQGGSNPHHDDLHVALGALDKAGNAVVFGPLTKDSAQELESYIKPGSGGFGGGPAPQPKPMPHPVPPPNIKPPSVTVAPVTTSGKQTLKLGNTAAYAELATIAEIARASGLVSRAAKPPATVTVASARATIPGHATRKVTLKLSGKAMRTLRAKHTLTVTLRMTFSAKGHTSRTATRRVVLRLPRKR
jgi:hypothetical protein